MILITFALPQESAGLLALWSRCLSLGERRANHPGRLDGIEITVLHTGVGAVSASKKVSECLATLRPLCLLSAGLPADWTRFSKQGTCWWRPIFPTRAF